MTEASLRHVWAEIDLNAVRHNAGVMKRFSSARSCPTTPLPSVRNVSRGVWRDYAIDHRDGRALFSVFRHTQESPLYTIVKVATSPAAAAEFFVMSGRQRISAGPTLAETLEFFRSKLALVAN